MQSPYVLDVIVYIYKKLFKQLQNYVFSGTFPLVILRFERVPFKTLALHFFSWIVGINAVHEKQPKRIMKLLIKERNSTG